MSHDTPPKASPAIAWSDAARAEQFTHWLADTAASHDLLPDSLRLASADASFRRYFRIDAQDGSRIIMDAPPDKENSAPFVKVAGLMHAAGVHAPQVLAWDEPLGFMLLTDLGAQTMMQVINREQPQANLPLYLQAVDALI
ncbi:MAG TPA: phosphotransferase, partial [Rhodoferax sp.]|nr:phosphotransferase [Rhodoferax sp.]